MAELPELALRFVAVAQGAAGVEFRSRALKLGDGAIALTGLSECAARERPREGCLDRRPDLIGGGGRSERLFGCIGGVARRQGDGCCRSVGPGAGQWELQGGGRGLRAGGCAFRLGVVVERESAAREQFEAVEPPATGNARLLLASSPVEEQLEGTFGLPGFEQGTGEPDGRPGRNEAFVQFARELDALFCRANGDV